MGPADPRVVGIERAGRIVQRELRRGIPRGRRVRVERRRRHGDILRILSRRGGRRDRMGEGTRAGEASQTLAPVMDTP